MKYYLFIFFLTKLFNKTSSGSAPPVCEVTSNIKVFRHDECNKFWECRNETIYLFECPPNLQFNLQRSFCDWPEKANCNPIFSIYGDRRITRSVKFGHKKLYRSSDSEELENFRWGGTDREFVINNEENVFDGKESSGEIEWSDSTEVINTDFVFPSSTVKPIRITSRSTTTSTTSTTTTTTTKPTTTTSIPSPETTSSKSSISSSTMSCDNISDLCPMMDGVYPVYLSLPECSKFCQCSNGKAYDFVCPPGLHFNAALNLCDFPKDSICISKSSNVHKQIIVSQSKVMSDSYAFKTV